MLATEAAEQRALIKWSKYHPIARNYLMSSANGGYRNPKEAKNLKLQGVKAGVSDLFLAYPIPPYSGLWIELKRRSKYVVSKEQLNFLELMRKAGYRAEVAIGWEEAAKLIEDYLK